MAMSGDTSGVTALRDALSSPEVALRRNAAWLLGLMGNASAGGMLKLKLDDPDALVALRAAEALHRLGSDEGLDTVRTLVDHERHEIRCWAARLLGPMGTVADVPRLEHECQSRFLDVKFEAIAALAERGDLKRIELLLEFVGAPDADTRLVAIRALGETAYTPAIDRLTAVMNKGDLAERTAAAGAILRIQSARQPWRSRILADRPPAAPAKAPGATDRAPEGR
jgi:HEAT repeat protein